MVDAHERNVHDVLVLQDPLITMVVTQKGKKTWQIGE